MNQIYHDQELWLKLRKNARQLVENQYDWQKIFSQYESEILTKRENLKLSAMTNNSKF